MRPRLSIAGMLVAVLCCALGLAALRFTSPR